MPDNKSTTSKTCTIWIVEAKERPNEVLRAALEAEAKRQFSEPALSLRFISEADILKPLRFALLPELLIIACGFKPALEPFVKSAGNPPIWVDLTYQTKATLASFQAMCQANGLEGSTLEFSAANIPWALRLLETYRLQQGSLLHGVLSAGELQAPVIHTTRLAKPEQIGVRIDHLAAAAGVQVAGWYLVVASLASLALELAEEFKAGGSTVVPMYAAELVAGAWLVLFQVPVAKKHQGKLQPLMARIREDQALRGKLGFRVATRECGALAVTFSEALVEIGVVFNPSEVTGARLADAEGASEALLFRKRHYTAAFNPQNCRYVTFPERLHPREIDAGGVDAGGVLETGDFPGEVAGHVAPGVVTKFPAGFDKVHQQLAHMHRVGSDETFAAFLKGVEAASNGEMMPRYVRLIESVNRAATPENSELLKDIIKRFFALVEETRGRRQQRSG